MKYDFTAIEKKWQEKWLEEKPWYPAFREPAFAASRWGSLGGLAPESFA